MPTLPVNDKGAVIYYEDSGVPNGSLVYLTLVIVHGYMFHSGGFLPMFPYAASHSVRIIALNLRDYPKSTPYSPEEKSLLLSHDIEQHRTAVRTQGIEMATFLKHLVVSENLFLTKGEDGELLGGVVLLSWSFGNIDALSMFGNVHYLDKETQDVLRHSLRKLVSYILPHYPAGIPLPEEFYNPLRDDPMLGEERSTAFGRWVTGFFEPPVYELTDDMDILGRCATSTDPNKASTAARLTPEEFLATADSEIVRRTPGFLKLKDLSVYRENAERTLFDCQPNDPLDHVDVVIMWCTEGPSLIPLTTYRIMKSHQEAVARGKKTRTVRFLKIEGANNFVHWHEPERFFQIVMDNLK